MAMYATYQGRARRLDARKEALRDPRRRHGVHDGDGGHERRCTPRRSGTRAVAARWARLGRADTLAVQNWRSGRNTGRVWSAAVAGRE